MSIRNHVQLIGHVGNTPEYKKLDSGTEIAKFSMGTHETRKNERGDKTTSTEWHNIVCFGSLAGVIEKYVSKGSHVSVVGHLKSRSYETANGDKKYITEIVIDEIEFLDKKPQ